MRIRPVAIALVLLAVMAACAGLPEGADVPVIPDDPLPIPEADNGPAVAAEAAVPARPRSGRESGSRRTVAKVRVARAAKCAVVADAVEWVHVRGDCKHGYAQGSGEANSADNQRRYRGAFLRGAFHGEGRYEWGDGTVYSGHFARGRKAGRGMISYPDGSRYSGKFKDDTYHGFGVYTAADGSIYEGEFRAGVFHGRGTYHWADGDRYEGEFRENSMAGEGVYVWRTGEQYVGQFRAGERNGTGTYTWPDGSRYVGQFKNGEMDGEGSLVSSDGSKYVGHFRNGKKHGWGAFSSAAGEIRQRWEDGHKTAEESVTADSDNRQAGRRTEPAGAGFN